MRFEFSKKMSYLSLRTRIYLIGMGTIPILGHKRKMCSRNQLESSTGLIIELITTDRDSSGSGHLKFTMKPNYD